MVYTENIGLVQLWPWPWGNTALACPWVELTDLGLEEWGLGLGTFLVLPQ